MIGRLSLAALLLGCSKSSPAPTETAPVAKVTAVALARTGVCVDAPDGTAVKVARDEPGNVDVILGQLPRDACLAGIEVYVAGSAESVKSLAELRTMIEHDHESDYALMKGPSDVMRDGRAMVTATFENHKNHLAQRQSGFMFGGHGVVITVYGEQLQSCEALESKLLATIRECAPAAGDRRNELVE